MVSWMFVAPKLQVREPTQQVCDHGERGLLGVSAPRCGGITDRWQVSFPPYPRQRDRLRHPPHDPTDRIFS